MEITITDQIIGDQITLVTDLVTIQILWQVQAIHIQVQFHIIHGDMNKCMGKWTNIYYHNWMETCNTIAICIVKTSIADIQEETPHCKYIWYK